MTFAPQMHELAIDALAEALHCDLAKGHEVGLQHMCMWAQWAQFVSRWILNRSQLLAEILSSPDLYVMQIEMDVYTLAKKVLLFCLFHNHPHHCPLIAALN